MSIRKTALSAGLALLTTGCAYTGHQNIHFAGLVKHNKPTPRTHEGNMDYVAYSRDYKHGDWNFENGVGVYKDSYGK